MEQLAGLDAQIAIGRDDQNVVTTIIVTGEEAWRRTMLVQTGEGDAGTADFAVKAGELAPEFLGAVSTQRGGNSPPFP